MVLFLEFLFPVLGFVLVYGFYRFFKSGVKAGDWSKSKAPQKKCGGNCDCKCKNK